MRNRITKQLSVWTLVVALCSLPATQVQAFELTDISDFFVEDIPNFFGGIDYSPVVEPFEVGFDVVIVRPLTISTLVIGSVLLVPALAISVADGEESRNDAIELFVTIPYEDAFQRELGDF